MDHTLAMNLRNVKIISQVMRKLHGKIRELSALNYSGNGDDLRPAAAGGREETAQWLAKKSRPKNCQAMDNIESNNLNARIAMPRRANSETKRFIQVFEVPVLERAAN